MKVKVAYLISHPIQHFCPMFKEWAKWNEWELKVFFASSAGMKAYYDPNFGKDVVWEGLYLDQFQHVFLSKESVNSSSSLDADNLNQALDEYNPDVVIILGYNQRYQRRALKWAHSNSKKILMFSDSELRQPRALYKKLIKKAILPPILNKVDAYLTTGNANEEYYQYYGVHSRKFYRSSYPIDTDVYETAFTNKATLRNEIRNKLGIGEEEIICSVVGKFVPWKNQVDLIRALKYVQNKSIRVMLVGSGELEDVLKQEANKYPGRVIFSGFIPAHQLPGYYAATDVYVHPSRKEPHSVAISEATYMGCPVIVSHTSGSYGTADDVRAGVNGFVYDNGDIRQLAEVLDKLASKELRESFGNASRHYAVQSQQTAKGAGLKAALLALDVI